MSCPVAQAFTDEAHAFLRQIEQEAKHSEDPVVERLMQYRQQIEKEAYSTTLLLCEGYRRATGMGPVKAHDGKYMYSESEAIAPWLKVFNEGLMQPFSAIGGLKADFIEVNNYGFFDYYFWARSLYSLYFLNSTGFLAGAMHCLDLSNHMNYFDLRKIQDFSNAIVYADIQGTAITEVGAGYVGGEVFGLIAKGARFALRPAARLMELLHIRIAKPQLLLGGIITLPIVADNFLMYMQKIDQQKAMVEAMMRGDEQAKMDRERRQRVVLLGQGYLMLEAAMSQEKALRVTDPSCTGCEKLYQELAGYSQAVLTAETLAGLRADAQALQFRGYRSAAPVLSKEDQLYLQLLQTVLPVMENLVEKAGK